MAMGERQRPWVDRMRVITSPTDSRSRLTCQNSLGLGLPSLFLAASSSLSCSCVREKPVPIGSMQTTSVNASQVSRLSVSRTGGGGWWPSSANATRTGPIAPMCRYADAAPGPPLKMNVSGRVAGSAPTAK